MKRARCGPSAGHQGMKSVGPFSGFYAGLRLTSMLRRGVQMGGFKCGMSWPKTVPNVGAKLAIEIVEF